MNKPLPPIPLSTSEH